MKKIYYVVALLLAVITTNAQPPKGMGSSDPEAKKILDAVSKKFKGFTSVQASYSFITSNRDGKKIGTKNGNLTLKGQKYKLTDGKTTEIVCDGKQNWKIDKEAKEVTVSKVDNDNQTITPQKMFTNFYDKDFLYKKNGTKGDLHEIELTPIDKRKNFNKVYVFISQSKMMITKAKVLEKSGNVFEYSISNVTTNGNVLDALFTYDAKKYPGFELIEN
jgi:outer membrane lipoprotein carrier protein